MNPAVLDGRTFQINSLHIFPWSSMLEVFNPCHPFLSNNFFRFWFPLFLFLYKKTYSNIYITFKRNLLPIENLSKSLDGLCVRCNYLEKQNPFHIMLERWVKRLTRKFHRSDLSRGNKKNTILKTQCISYHVMRKMGNTNDDKFHRSTFLGSKNIQVSRGNLLVVDSFYLFYHKA